MQKNPKPEVIKKPDKKNKTPGPERFHMAMPPRRSPAEGYLSPPLGLHEKTGGKGIP